MKFLRPFGIFFLLPSFCTLISAQAPGPSSAAAERERMRSEADLQRRMWDMNQLEEKLRAVTAKPRTPPPEPKLSAAERERVLKLRKVDAAVIEKYATLLNRDDSGIVKIFPDLGCVSKQVVRVSADCAKFVPLSSSFTFRTKNYGDEVYHDVHYKDEKIVSDSFFSQGIFVVVGDEPIEGVGLSHPGLKFLVDFQPDKDPKKAAEHAQEFRDGLSADGFRYTQSIDAKVGMTYAMRMIAYRLENGLGPITQETTMNEMMFHSLAYDKRVDIIFAFRILGRDENGGLTLVWKELARTEAGKIKFGKNQALRDFRGKYEIESRTRFP